MKASNLPSSILRSMGALALQCHIAWAGPVISIESNNGGAPQQVVNGDITPTESHLNFGTVDGNTSKILRYKIKNTGNESLRIPLRVSGPSSSSPQFVISGHPDPDDFATWTIPAGQDRNLAITYTPTSQSTSSLIVIQSNTEDPDDKTFAFFVAGKGNLGDAEAIYRAGDGTDRAIPNGDTNPTFAKGTNFGNVLVNLPTNDNPVNQYAIKSLALSPADGSDQLILSDARITGANASDFSFVNLGGNVNQGTQRNFEIKFDPSSPGEKTATLSVNTNEPGQSPYTFDLKGNGTTIPSALFEGRISTGTFGIIEDESTSISFNNGTAFGSTVVGGIKTNTYRITNNGDADLTLSTPGVPDGFSLNNFPAGPLSPGQSSEFTISFEPSLPGTQTGSFAVLTNIPGVPIFNFRISGLGTGPAITLQLQRPDETFGSALSSNASFFLGDVIGNGPDTSLTVVGEPTITGTLRITNSGNAPLIFSNPNLTSATNPAQYSLNGLSNGLSLEEGEFLDFTVSFDALSIGDHIGTVFINTNVSAQAFQFRVRAKVIEASEIAFFGRPADGSFSPISSGASNTSLGNGTAFPPPERGATTVTSTFEFRNVADTDLQYTFDRITGPHADEFEIASPSSGTLAPGTNRSFTIDFTPRDTSVRTAQFTLITNDPLHRRFTFALEGNSEGVDDPLEPKITSFLISRSDAEFKFLCQAGVSYRLRSSSTLRENSWSDVPEIPVILGTGTIQTLRITDLISRSNASLYYRIEEESP